MESKIAGGNELLNPEKILKEAGVSYGNVVADLGCGGMGYFSLQAGKLVGSKGQVYAVDILKSALASVETRVKLEGLENVKTVWSNLEVKGVTQIKENSLDFTLVVNVLFQSKKHREILQEAHRLLKTGGKLVVVDWQKSGAPLGPSSDHRVAPITIEEIAISLGFKKEKSFEAGPYHYGFVFIKQ